MSDISSAQHADDVRDQTWNARQKELMETWRQDADAVAVAEAHRDRLWQVYLEARADEREAFVNWQYACNAVETTKAHRRQIDGRGAGNGADT